MSVLGRQAHSGISSLESPGGEVGVVWPFCSIVAGPCGDVQKLIRYSIQHREEIWEGGVMTTDTP